MKKETTWVDVINDVFSKRVKEIEELKPAYEQTKKEILEAYAFLREKNHTIPSKTIELMKDTAIAYIDRQMTAF